MIVSDYSTGFTSNAILEWTKDHRIEWCFIARIGVSTAETLIAIQ
jgi:hypothetical protein